MYLISNLKLQLQSGSFHPKHIPRISEANVVANHLSRRDIALGNVKAVEKAENYWGTVCTTYAVYATIHFS